MKTKLYSMAVIAMMICAGLSSCSKDENDGEGGGDKTYELTVEDSDDGLYGRGMYFKIISETSKTAYVRRYERDYFKNSSSECIVPSSIKYDGNTYRVIEIGEEAFAGCGYITSFVMPNTITSIGERAFYQCKKLQSIVFSNKLTTISYECCYECYELKSVKIPNSVKTIEEMAFGDCDDLAEAIIGSSVTKLEAGAFHSCGSLPSITIPASVTTIEQGAFAYCYKLLNVTNLAKNPQKISDDDFDAWGTLHVKSGCKAAYAAAEGWKKFTIVEDAK